MKGMADLTILALLISHGIDVGIVDNRGHTGKDVGGMSKRRERSLLSLAEAEKKAAAERKGSLLPLTSTRGIVYAIDNNKKKKKSRSSRSSDFASTPFALAGGDSLRIHLEEEEEMSSDEDNEDGEDNEEETEDEEDSLMDEDRTPPLTPPSVPTPDMPSPLLRRNASTSSKPTTPTSPTSMMDRGENLPCCRKFAREFAPHSAEYLEGMETRSPSKLLSDAIVQKRTKPLLWLLEEG